MERFDEKTESGPAPKDISSEFLSMRAFDFLEFLRSQRKEPALSITIDWKDVWTANRLKAWLEDRSSGRGEQKRQATIRATDAQYREGANAFSSGVRREKVE